VIETSWIMASSPAVYSKWMGLHVADRPKSAMRADAASRFET
jgi:hypothetical protein